MGNSGFAVYGSVFCHFSGESREKSCAGAQGLLALRFSRGSQDRLPQICGSFSF